MGFKHKAYKQTLDRGFASEWNDSHQFDPTEEFTQVETLIFASLTDRWDSSQKSGAGAITVSCEGADGVGHLFASLSSGTGAGDYISIRPMVLGSPINITSPVELPILTTSVYLATVDSIDTPIEIGLFEFDTVPFTANQAGFYFRIKANHLYAVVGDGTGETEEDLGLLSSFGTSYLVLRVEVQSATVRFYVNNMVSSKIGITTHRPVKNLTAKFSCIKTTNGENVLKFDSVAIQRLRKT